MGGGGEIFPGGHLVLFKSGMFSNLSPSTSSPSNAFSEQCPFLRPC